MKNCFLRSNGPFDLVAWNGRKFIMLHATFQDHRTISSVEEDIFTIINGHGVHLGHLTGTIYIKLLSPFPRRLYMKFGFDWQSSFRKEDV